MKRTVVDPTSLRNRGPAAFLRLWGLVELDFQSVYGIDLSTPGLLHERSWRWLIVRLYGLLSVKSRVQRVLNPSPEEKKADAQRST